MSTTSYSMSIARPINTSIQLPPPPSDLVSPISQNSAAGSPTPTPGTEKKSVFWNPNYNSSEERRMVFSTGNTPASEKRRGFWSPIQSPSDKKTYQWPQPPKTPAVGKRPDTLSASHKAKGQNVSWSDSSWESDRSKGQSSQDPESSQSDNSRANSPALPEHTRTPNTASSNESLSMENVRNRVIQMVDKKAIAMSWDIPPIEAHKEPHREPPFLSYTDYFLQILGQNPSMVEILNDSRAPFFGGSGCFHRPTSTLFLTSALMKDRSPGMVSSRNYSTITTSITFFAGTDSTRDKVRFAENYMPGGSCVWHPAASPKTQNFSGKRTQSSGSSPVFSSSIVMCSRGTLGTPAGLIQVAPRRPHTVTPMLTSYPGGRPFNSPHSVVALSDGSLLFSDPPIGYEIGYRPRPQMPPLVHRFDPATGDVRAVADGLTRPTCIAVSPDERTVYVVDAPRAKKQPGRGRHFEEVLEICSAPMPTIQAYNLVGVTQGLGVGGSGVFLTNKRLFAFPGLPNDAEPVGLAVSGRGDVLVACGTEGILVYAKDGTLIGKIRCPKGDSITGLCCGRKGELFCWGGSKVWQVSVDSGKLS